MLYRKGTLEEQRRVKRQQELDDFNDEVAGRSNGKMRRAGAEDAKHRDDKPDIMDATELMTMAWNEAFVRVNHLVDATDRATEEALAEARQEAHAAAEELRQIQERAATLDGRRVYRDDDGQVYAEDGSLIDPQDAAGIKWPDNAPSRAEFQSADQKSKDAERNQKEIEDYQTRLQEAREKLDGANPETLDLDRLEEIERELDEDVPEAIRRRRDQILASEPEPPSYAAQQARAAQNEFSDRSAVQTVTAAPKVAMPLPGG